MSDEADFFYLNTGNFDEKFKELMDNTIPELAARGLKVGADALLNDADQIVPKTPKKSGDLRGSKQTLPATQAEVTPEGITIRAGFNMPYAARLHEGEPNWNWSEPGSGPKYLEAKMAANPQKYVTEIPAAYIKDHQNE